MLRLPAPLPSPLAENCYGLLKLRSSSILACVSKSLQFSKLSSSPWGYCRMLATSASRADLIHTANSRLASLQPQQIRPGPRHVRGVAQGTTRSKAALCIQEVYTALEDGKSASAEPFDPQLNDGKLLLDLGPKGQYSLEETADGRLCLFSPISGPRYYDFDQENGWWSNRQDGHLLYELFVREIMHITAVCVNL